MRSWRSPRPSPASIDSGSVKRISTPFARFIRCTGEAAARFQELKRARAGLDFTDVLLEAVSLLEKRGEFSQSRFRLESRYHHLLIDEFQDTNEYQWRLIRALVDSWGEGSGLVQEAILSEQSKGDGQGRIREPSLFLVGDRKQSIYGWRDARVEVMEKASRHLLRIRNGGGRKLTLRHSFRASGEILSFLNDLFSEVPRARGDLEWSFQYREADHFPTAPVLATASEPVGIARYRAESRRGFRSGRRRDRPASRGGGSPAERHRHPLPKPIVLPRVRRRVERSRRSGLRIPGPRILRLSRSPGHPGPGPLSRGAGFEASGRGARAISIRRRLRLCPDADVEDFGASQRRSAESPVARWLGRGAIDLDLPLSEMDRAAVERASRLIPSFLPLVDRIPAFELLERILRESDYARWFVHDRQAWENLKKVMEMVRRAENRGYLTMSRLADFLEAAATDDESRAVLEAVDAVNLMTIHAAKGLEFDSVFLVNMHQRRREDTSLPRIRELADGGIEVTALGAFDSGPDSSDPNALDAPNRVEEEEKRLLYVALTRARRRLALSAVAAETFEQERSLLGLLPQSFQVTLQDVFDAPGDVSSIEWRGHPLRILRPAAGRQFHRSPPDRRDVLRLEPLSADAYESEARSNELETGPDVPVPAELLASGEVRRHVPFAFARGAQVHRGVFDLLVIEPGRATVIERLAAPPSADDRSRMDLYLEALASALPDRPDRPSRPDREVKGIFLFAGAPPESIERRDGGPQLRLF